MRQLVLSELSVCTIGVPGPYGPGRVYFHTCVQYEEAYNAQMLHTLLAEEKDWDTFAQHILEVLPQKEDATVVALYGELGAGKTTFVQALARRLGIFEYVTSPTFLIMKTYDIKEHPHFKTLVHIDAYRVEDKRELAVLRLNELFADPHNLICIEWAGRIEELLPEDRMEVTILYDAPTGIRNIDYGQKRD